LLVFTSISARAADGDKTVEQLAKEGHWMPQAWETHEALLNKPAPKLDLSNWVNGELKESDIKGKILVVDYWATWCGPCIAGIPKNNELAKKYADKGVLFVGACGGGGEEKMNEVVQRHKIEYSTARVTPESTRAWKVQWWPTYAVVDRKGNLRAIGLKPDYVAKVVDAVLKEQPAEQKKDEKKAKAAAREVVARPVLAAAKGDEGKARADWLEGTAAQRGHLAGLEGKAAPDLMVKDWTNGKEMKVADLKGKVVLLDFWATWCGPCIAAIPHTNELHAKYKDKGLVIIGVCHSRGAETMAQMAKDKSIAYPVAADIEGKTVAAYKVNSFPDYYFIDKSGVLRVADCRNDKVEEVIEALLAEGEVARAEK
jgi:thiol-disulfide isomerase/thioredoxin